MNHKQNIQRTKQRNKAMKNNRLITIFTWLAALMLAPTAFAVELQNIDVASLPGDKIEIKLSFDGQVDEPRGYTIEQPARIALDLPGVSNKSNVKNRELSAGNARSMTLVEAQGRTRLIINMTKLSGYATRVQGNNLFIVVGEDSGTARAQLQEQASPAMVVSSETTKKAKKAARSIKNIDFKRGEAGEGNVVVDLGDSGINPEIQEQSGQIRLFFPRTSLPEELRVRLDVTDFATPVSFIKASERSDGVLIDIEPNGSYDYLSFQADNKLTVSVKSMSREEIEKRNAERFTYTGEKLSLNFQDIDVRSVLQLIADFTELNLVASDSVAGNITLRLHSVPWDQALDLVLKTKGLDKRKVGNVLLVGPADEIAERERKELESKQKIADLAPLRRDLIQVNYAKAAQIAALFQQVTNKEGDMETERGSITFDERTNSIIAYHTQERLDELRRLVAQLDIPVRQVMIEARIVEANVDFEKSLGVSWGASARSRTARNSTAGTTINSASQKWGGNSSIDLGATDATSALGIGFVSSRAVLDLELSAMEKSGFGEIVSQPKVVTADKESASIMKGMEIPYQIIEDGTTSTEFKEAFLSLEVVPQITPDNRIIMEVRVNKDEPDFANTVNGEPTIRKNEVNAKVLVNDGETIVIGGVFSNTQRKQVEKVPFLGDVPVVGRLFRKDFVQDEKSELLIFLTPRIMHANALTLN